MTALIRKHRLPAAISSRQRHLGAWNRGLGRPGHDSRHHAFLAGEKAARSGQEHQKPPQEGSPDKRAAN
jgi:hypothetical protein